MPFPLSHIPIWLLFLITFFSDVHAYWYCNRELSIKLCGSSDTEHFLCNVEDQVPRESNELLVVHPFSFSLQYTILATHNNIRNNLANGSLESAKAGKNFPSASRMRVLAWDRELEYSATVHAAQCSVQPDLCHNTQRFPMSGQIIASLNRTYEEHDVKGHLAVNRLIQVTLNIVQNEKDTVEDPEAFIKAYHESTHATDTPRFTKLIEERIGLVGCGMARCQNVQKQVFTYHITCNYDANNVRRVDLYKTGAVASDCEHYGETPSKEYQNLCTNSGKIHQYDVDQLQKDAMAARNRTSAASSE